MTNQRTLATNRLSACEAAIAGLSELHAQPRERLVAGGALEQQHRAKIAGLYDDVRQGTALARVHALLYIGDQVARLVDKLDDGRLSRDEVDALIAAGDQL